MALELSNCHEHLDFILKPYNFRLFFEILTIVACIRVARFCNLFFLLLFVVHYLILFNDPYFFFIHFFFKRKRNATSKQQLDCKVHIFRESQKFFKKYLFRIWSTETPAYYFGLSYSKKVSSLRF